MDKKDDRPFAGTLWRRLSCVALALALPLLTQSCAHVAVDAAGTDRPKASPRIVETAPPRAAPAAAAAPQAASAPVVAASEASTKTTVLALQAFFDDASEARLRAAWTEAMQLPGTTCAVTLGARPHMTFGSWNVLPSKIPEAVEKLRATQKQLTGRTVAVRVAEWRPGNFFLEPAEKPDPALAAWHSGVHGAIAFPYQHFRPGDIPGQWEPHLTMFNCTAENAEAGRRIAERVAQGGPLTVARFGLVTFGPIREQCVVGTVR